MGDMADWLLDNILEAECEWCGKSLASHTPKQETKCRKLLSAAWKQDAQKSKRKPKERGR